MAQKTAWTGAILTESDINTYLMHEGNAWTTYTPTLTAGATVTKTVTHARWARSGRKITVEVLLTITGAGTASNPVAVGLPVAAVAAAVGGTIGSFHYQDTGTSIYSGAAMLASTTTVSGQAHALGAYIGQAPAFTTANTDLVSMLVVYESAT